MKKLKYYLQVVTSSLTIHYLAAFILSLCVGIGACDHVDEEDRWTRVDLPVLPAEDRTTILVEEYTGQQCINCPGAAAELARITQNDSKHIITVALHAESTGQTLPELACSEASEYARLFKIPRAVPGILINRQVLPKERYLQDKSIWNSLIYRAVHTKARCRLQLEIQAESPNTYRVTIQSQSLDNVLLQRPIALQLWAVEDIRTQQQLPHGPQPDYFHHNVLRGALNGSTGTPHQLGKKEERVVTLPRNVKVTDNAKIIAFLYDTTTKEVYEAALVALGKGIQPDIEKPDGGNGNGENGGGTSSTDLTIFCADKPLEEGSEIVSDKIDTYLSNGVQQIEVVSPLLYVQPGQEKQYTFELSKIDHAGIEYGGLGQICIAGQCMDSPDTEQFILSEFKPVRNEFIQIHYRIGSNYQNIKCDYRVKLSIKHQDTIQKSVILKFSYDPDQTEQKPEPPIPPVDPTPPVPPVDPTPPVPPTPPADPKQSNLLVMDFTGQRCGYCIEALKPLAYQETLFPHNLVVVSIHTDNYNVDSNLIYDDWYTYAAKLGLGGLPKVVYNNVFEDTNIRYYVGEFIRKAPLYRSKLTAKRNGRSVNLHFQAEAVDKESVKNKSLNVLFWITENGIKGYQSGEGDDFIHNHILRGPLNGIWGQSYPLGTNISLQADLPSKTRVPENCDLIAILVDPVTQVFYDAVKVSLK